MCNQRPETSSTVTAVRKKIGTALAYLPDLF
jgi:hypothetical protein